MEDTKTISGKVVAIVIGLLLLLGALGAGGYYLWQQSTQSVEVVVTTDSSLTGSVVYRERVPLPPGSSLVVQLLDVTDPAAEPLLVAEQTIITRGENVPISYAIPFNASQISAERRYAVEASILGEGDLYFATTEFTPVLTADNPTSNVDLLLTQNGVKSAAVNESGEKVTLVGEWVWVRTDNDPLAPTSPFTSTASSQYVLTFRDTSTFNSTTDCNRIAGNYVINGKGLTLGAISMTELACPDTVDTVYAAQLGRITSQEILGTELRLILGQDSGVMIFTQKTGEVETPTPVVPVPENPDEPVSSDEAGTPTPEPDGIMCTMDVMTCPDGSFVGRVAPSCAFAACPGL